MPPFRLLFYFLILIDMSELLDSQGKEVGCNWFEEWFNHPLYLELYSHRDHAEAARCIHTILSISGFNLKEPSSLSVLDMACGAGRHALELARLDYSVTGNDLSPFLLEEARKAASESSLSIDWTCCDMRDIQSDSLYDLVVQLFTSFGYFDMKEDDQLVLQRVYKLLKRGGWYVLDLLNPLHLANNLVAQSRRTVGELAVYEDRELHDNRIVKRMTISSPSGETITFRESVRLYNEEEILAMLQQEGFAVSSIVGNYDGEPFLKNDSPRMMIFCQKR